MFEQSFLTLSNRFRYVDLVLCSHLLNLFDTSYDTAENKILSYTKIFVAVGHTNTF